MSALLRASYFVLRTFAVLFLVAILEPSGAQPAWDDEFVGPFASWANGKTDYGAKGDGVADDTAALQLAFSEVGTPGHSPVLFLPDGTYRVTATLHLISRINIGVVGANSATTTLKWAGADGGTLAEVSGVAYSKIDRLTFDGAGHASVLVDQAWDCHGNYFDTGNEYADDAFRNAAVGIRGGLNCGFAETSVWRSQFANLTTAGIALGNFNALDLWVWYSRFEDCAVGVTNEPGAGNYHVYNSVFRRSRVSDLFMKNTGGFNIRNNTSIGSRAFFTGAGPYHYPASVTLQGNAITTGAASPIAIANQGPALIVDNTIASKKAGPAITVGYDAPSADGDALLVGNTFTTVQPFVVKGRSMAIDNTTSPRLVVTEPALPPTPPRRKRPVFDVAAGADAAAIQQAINSALQAGSRAVVHLPAGNYAIDTPLVVPSHADIQMIGDGSSTVLRWSGAGGGPVLHIQGPTRAALRDFAVQAPGAKGVLIDQADQPGSRLYLHRALISSSAQSNLKVEGVDYLVVDARDIGHADGPGQSVMVIGGPLAAGGSPQTATVDIFSGASCCFTGSAYGVSNGASLLVRDIWYESGGAVTYLTATGNGFVTVSGVRDAQPPSVPSFDFDSFHGVATLLQSGVDSHITIHGDAGGSVVFGNGVVMAPGVANYLSDISNPTGQVAFQQMRMSDQNGSSSTLSDTGVANPALVRQMLAQTRREQPQVINRLPGDRTDVRLYRVSIERATIGLHVTP